MTRLIPTIFVAVFALSTAAAAAGQWGARCHPTVQKSLSAAGIGSGDIGDVSYTRFRNGGDDTGIAGYNAWVRVKSCKSGYVVVETDTFCNHIQTYAFGQCRVPGL